MILERVLVGAFGVNCYILAGDADKEAVIIDPGDEKDKIVRILNRHTLKPGIVVNTHGHFDHIGCDDSFGVTVYIHASDAAMLKDSRKNYSALFGAPRTVAAPVKYVSDKARIACGSVELEALHIPGHSAGGIALLLRTPESGIVFTGDTLFCQGIGRSDLGGDERLLIKSIREKLLALPDGTVVYPGHGPATTIGDEKRDNPFLQ